LDVFRKKAQEKNSQLLYFPEIAELSDIKVTAKGTDFSLNIHNSTIEPYWVSVPGKVQAENAALAIAGIKTAFSAPDSRIQISEESIRKGLANLNIPARFENIAASPEQPPFIIDGAHTPESLSLCVETFCSLYGEGGILLFGCAADKDAAAMAKIAHTSLNCSRFSKIIITTPGTFKTSNPAQVYEAFAETAGEKKTQLIKDTQEAIRLVSNLAEEKKLPVLGTGSFYLVSEIRKFVCP
jgi:dihydrofolate synthase/folylpolyglutamate synthase